jgi:murein DD-endopeptidase MepM/ murein hydrolase activator NlpD
LIPLDEFKKKALEQGIDENIVNQYLNNRMSQSIVSQPTNITTAPVPLGYQPNIQQIPPGRGANISLTSARGIPITQQFGNYNPALYRGINKSMRNTGVDLRLPEGSPVTLPPGQWQVVEANRGYNRGYGNSILVKNSQTGETLRFSHLSKMPNLRRGQTISGGGVIALTGKTGHATGPHLDLEYRNPQGQLANALTSPYGRYF